MRIRTRPEEPDGEVYGEDRLDRLEQRIAELRGEVPDDNGASYAPDPADDTAGGERGS
jgi:hypothetical protein